MHRRLLALVTAVLLAAAAACGDADSPKTADGKDMVNVGAISIIDVAPLYLGKQKGFFDKRKIDLTITPTQGGAASVPGVMSGQFTFAFSNVTSLLIARDQGLDLRAVAAGNSSTGRRGDDFSAVLVRKNSPIKSARDLAGRTVSVNNLHNIGDTTVRAAVRKAGGDPGAVKFLELGFPDALGALAKNRVDAIWVVEPFVTQARQKGDRVVAWNFADAAPNLTISEYFATAETVKKHSGLVKRFGAAMRESLRYASDHPDEARAAIRSYMKVSPALADKIVLSAWPEKVNEQSVRTLADLAQQDGLLSKKADIKPLIP